MSNNFNNLNTARSLMEDANKLAIFHSKFNKAINENSTDKHKKGFNADSRFMSFSADIFFSAYTGQYGSSSVYDFLNLKSGDELGGAFIQYIKNNEEAVIKGMAVILDEKAKALISEAEAEVKSALASINNIKNNNPIK